MPNLITYEGGDFNLLEGETVLEGLLRLGQDVPHSCKAGACQSCLMQANSPVPDGAQTGLKDTLKAQNFFLACQCVPVENMQVSLPSMVDTTVEAEVIAIEKLCHNVVMLRLKPLADFSCHAGQYISLVRKGGAIVRSYSVANLADKNGLLDLHIRRIEGGCTSVWAHDAANVGDRVHLRGPAGNCFYYSKEDKSFPLVLAGTGTGLAPLEGVVLDALAQGHKGEIHLLHGALVAKDLYHTEKLQALAARYSQMHYTPCVLDEGQGLESAVMDILARVDKAVVHTYFCGAPEMVNQLKQKAFLTGVASKNIFSDPFVGQGE